MTSRIVGKYGKMWPRQVFQVMKGNKLLLNELSLLRHAGVYILYRDEHPYYVGKARTLFSRLHSHANKITDTYCRFWNYFSFFVVEPKHVGELESILIAAMPTSNRAKPKIPKLRIPEQLVKVLLDTQRVYLKP